MVPLGSRKQLCINDQVRALGQKGGDERMNEACLEMQKSGLPVCDEDGIMLTSQGKDRCPHLPSKADETAMIDARDSVLVRRSPFSSAPSDPAGDGQGYRGYRSGWAINRRLSLLHDATKCQAGSGGLQRQTTEITSSWSPCRIISYCRRTLERPLTSISRDKLLLSTKLTVGAARFFDDEVDPVPDLIDTLLSIHSTTITHGRLSTAVSQVQQYLSRFQKRLKPVHAVWIRQTLAVLQGLEQVCVEFLKSNPEHRSGPGRVLKSEILNVNDLVARAGRGSDQINLMEMLKYLKDSKLARKISGFVERSAELATNGADFFSLRSH